MHRNFDGIGNEGDDIRHLFTYNLQRLAGLSSRIAMLGLQADHGLSIAEWRALAVLDFLGVAPMYVLARSAGVQKSQMSRLVTGLEKRGLVQREQHPSDRRSIILGLSAEGKSVVKDVLAEGRERNRRMLAALAEEERCTLMHLLGKVTVTTERFLQELKAGTGEAALPKPEPVSLFHEEQVGE